MDAEQARREFLDAERASALDTRGVDLASVARVLADAAHHGRHRAGGRGGSAEFYDVRAYTHGDPVRMIDWRLAGRTDRLYLRRHRQEGQLGVVVVVDASASMRFGGIDRPRAITKLRRAQELAAALVYLAVRRGDRAGVVVWRGGEVLVEPVGAGWPAMHRCVRALERADAPAVDAAPQNERGAGAPGAGIGAALGAAGPLLPRGGVVIVVSDLLDEPDEFVRAAGALRFGGGGGGVTGSRGAGARDVIAVQMLTRDEIDPPMIAGASWRDPERAFVSRAGDDGAGELGAAYRSALGAHIEGVRRALERMGARHCLCTTEQDAVDALRRVLGA